MHLDPQETIIQALCSAGLFLLMWFLLSKILFKPFFALLDERESKTTGAEAGAGKTREEIARLRTKLSEADRALRLQGIAVRDKVVQKSKVQGQELVAEAERTTADQLNRAKDEIRSMRQKAQSELNAEIDRVAALIMENAATVRSAKSNTSTTIH